MAGARKMGVAKSLYGRVFVAVAGRMPVAGADLAPGIRVRGELDHAERGRGSGKGVPFPGGADHLVHGIDRRRRDLRRGSGGQQGRKEKEGPHLWS